MPKFTRSIALLLVLMAGHASIVHAEKIIARDGDATISESELTFMIGQWTEQMRAVAIADEGDRLELINLELAGVKVANEADKLIADDDQLRLAFETDLRNFKRNFVLKHYQDSIKYPDFTRLAKERYEVEPEKYGLVKERRLASHILLSSPPGQPREEKLAKAQEILDQLRAGADWQKLVEEYSGEPNAAEKGGLFDYWMTYGDKRVSPPFSEAVFSISSVGEFAEVTQSQFGVHIIRLDGIKEESYKPFAEVKGNIVKDLKNEYTRLAMKEYLSRFNMSDKAEVDEEAVEAALAPYVQAAEPEVEPEPEAEILPPATE